VSVGRPGTAAAPHPVARLGRRTALALSLLVAIGALSLLAGPAVGAPAGAGPTAEAATARIAWKACGDRLQCARVQVPLDWSRPGGPTITLSVIRHPASRPDQRIGSMFFNPGGPGSSGVEEVRRSADLLDQTGQGRFDVVSWDPRGTGASTRVRCFADPAARERFWGDLPLVPTTVAAQTNYQRKAVEYGRRCAQASGDLLKYISAADTVRDMDHLRRLVGDRQLTYYGWSYGTVLGQTYANMFPRRVRAMILDGLLDPRPFTTSIQAAIGRGLVGTDLTFREFQRLCELAGPERCALAGKGSSVRARVKGLIRRLQRGSIPAPSARPAGRLTYSDLLATLFVWTPGPATWPTMAEALNQAADGDGSAVKELANQLPPIAHAAIVPAAALQCADKPPPTVGSEAWPEVIPRFARANFALGPTNGWWLWAPCATWPVESPNRYAGPWNATTPNPVLVVGTRADPRTPYPGARAVAGLLGNAVLLTHDGYGHTTTVDRSACVIARMGDYLTGLTTPPPGTVCPSDRQPFDPDFGEPLP
jgi:pimeloyl-ACP methyl ester carboxylesterase